MEGGLRFIMMLILILGVSTVIAGAVAITLAEFEETTTDVDAINIINNGSDGILTVAEQFPTLGIIGVMIVIIGLLVSVFGYIGMRQIRG